MEKFSRKSSLGFVVLLLLAVALVVFAFSQFNSQKKEGIVLEESFKTSYQPILLNHSDEKGFSFSYPQGYYIEKADENSSSYLIWAGEPPLLEVITVDASDFITDSEITSIKNTFSATEVRKFEETTVNGKKATLLNAFINESGVSGFHRQGFVQCSNANGSYTVVLTGIFPEELAPDAILADAMIQSVRC